MSYDLLNALLHLEPACHTDHDDDAEQISQCSALVNFEAGESLESDDDCPCA